MTTDLQEKLPKGRRFPAPEAERHARNAAVLERLAKDAAGQRLRTRLLAAARHERHRATVA